MNLTLANIKQLTDSTTYNRGSAYAEQGTVFNLDVKENKNEVAMITAMVLGSKTYKVTGTITSKGIPTNFKCTCPAFEQYAGLCKHCVAVLYKTYYTKSESSRSNVDTANSGKNARILTVGIWQPLASKSIVETEKPVQNSSSFRLRNSSAVNSLIEAYSQEAVYEAVGAAVMPDEKVKIIPTIRLLPTKLMPYLEITIGNKRQYVVRDLYKFAQRFKNNEEFSYGKGLNLVHTIENFDEQSRPLLRIILEKIEEINEYRNPSNSYSYYYYSSNPPANKKSFGLYPAIVDRIFNIYENQIIKISYDDGDMMVKFLSQNPKIEVKAQYTKGVSMLLKTERFDCFPGEQHVYFLSSDTLYRCDKKMTKSLKVFLEGLMQDRFKILITEKTLPAFCCDVLPAIQGYVSFSGDTDVFSEFAPTPLEIEMFFDMPSPEIVSCEVVFNYGTQKIIPDLSASEIGSMNGVVVARDMKQELVFKVVTDKYFNEKTKNQLFANTEESIYALLEDGLDELSQLAKIEVTDRFRKQKITPPPRVSVGVALDGGLLELTMDTDAFSINELAGVLKAYKEKRKYYRLKDGGFLRLNDGALSGVSQIAEGLNITGKELAKGKITIPAYRSLYLDRVLRANENIRFDRNSEFKNLVRNIKSVEDSDFEVPKTVSGILRNYQKTGYRWLKTMESYHFGGILADDMGLGKTIQVIALLLSSFEQGVKKPSLIVCPSSLVFNWESEFHKFSPQLKIRTIAGTTARRQQDIQELEKDEIAVTSYDLLKRDIEQYQNTEFQYEIIDEAQYIKNHNTQNAKAVKAIKSVQRFALTGTPIENRLSELWSIFDFLMPGYCFSYNKFRQRFELPIVRDKDEIAREQFGRMVAPFLLRRLKQDVLSELPPKEETVLRTVLTGEQQRLYAANQSMLKEEIREKLAESSNQQGKLKILALLTRLRQICCDPSLCYEGYNDGSAKLEMCMELINEAVDGGHKVLLFSQFTSMLKIISDRLDAQGIAYYVLQGSTSKAQRMTLVEQFNTDKTPIFLISLKAGGTGLNLTGADIVIHYDPWWNIAAQNQATDRAHRIGQKNSVHVYKLVAQDTIEERILNLQESKLELAQSVVSSTGEQSILGMSIEDIKQLL